MTGAYGERGAVPLEKDGSLVRPAY
jgi:hypothetical protein